MSSIQDTTKTLLGKGKDVISSLASSAGDMASRAKIKAQIAEQSLQHDTLMRKLGEAVYEELKKDERYAQAFPEIFEQIAVVDERKQALEDELARMDEGDDEKGLAGSELVDAQTTQPDSEMTKEDAE